MGTATYSIHSTKDPTTPLQLNLQEKTATYFFLKKRPQHHSIHARTTPASISWVVARRLRGRTPPPPPPVLDPTAPHPTTVVASYGCGGGGPEPQQHPPSPPHTLSSLPIPSNLEVVEVRSTSSPVPGRSWRLLKPPRPPDPAALVPDLPPGGKIRALRSVPLRSSF